MGDVFPELRAQQAQIEKTLRREEESFNRTLDKGIALFEAEVARLTGTLQPTAGVALSGARASRVLARRLAVANFHSRRNALCETSSSPLRAPLGYLRSNHLSTRRRRLLSAGARTIVLDAFRHFEQIPLRSSRGLCDARPRSRLLRP